MNRTNSLKQAGIAVIAIALPSCSPNEITEPFESDIYEVILRNTHDMNIHVWRDGEASGPTANNRLTPGASRRVNADFRIIEGFQPERERFFAGREATPNLDEVLCSAPNAVSMTDATYYRENPPEVHWNGAGLECVGWDPSP